MPPPADSQKNGAALRVLTDVFGHGSFRGVQDRAVANAMAGKNSMVLMPTGGGKSLCYQVPAIARPGAGIVISPLVSLMEDQVRALRAKGVAAVALTSAMGAREAAAAENGILSGAVKIAYVSPERLANPRFLSLLDRARVSLFALDEAHCVSQWGYDFRPDYLDVGIIASRWPDVPRMALTATASPGTRDDIAARFGLADAEVFSTSFDRPNIDYRIEAGGDRRRSLEAFIRRHAGSSGIVYCHSRALVEETAAWLCGLGFNALRYHAGMSPAERTAGQERFLSGHGVIAVATVAFGMGIDKPDVRFVAHCGLPGSIEAYYQETGRAGRDGLPSEALMVWNAGDADARRRLIQSSDIPKERRAIEISKLGAVLALCETPACRRQVLLGYFGERHAGGCCRCDRCRGAALTWDATLPVQKAISAALRTGEMFGAAHLADVLMGRRTPKAVRFGHDRIRTFGAGSDLDAGRWRSVFRQITSAGYLEPDPGRHGGLRATAKGREAIRPGAQPVRLVFEDDGGKGALRASDVRAANTLGDAGGRLLNALKQVRAEAARARGVPVHAVFSDAVLVEIVRRAPRDMEALGAVPGVSPVRAAGFGPAVLAAIAAEAAAQDPGPPAPDGVPAP